MRMHVFTVLDKAVGAYLTPFFARSKGEALRSFSEACHDQNSLFHKHSTDYLLMYLGEFDDVTGLFVSGEPERLLGAFEAVSGPEREPSLKAVN